MKRLVIPRPATALVALGCVVWVSLYPEPLAGAETVSLAGQWRFQLDRDDAGVPEQWFTKELKQTLCLPGALQNQGFGDDITVDTRWTGETGKDRWLRQPQYERYRQPGNIKVPFFLQPEKHYVGAAWYQRDIEIPKAWTGQRIVLTLERPHWGTHVWLDDRFIGTNLSLSTPHVYDLGMGVAPGRHTLTLRVDNRVLVEVGDWAHSVSDHTQGNWNGMVGRIELSATEPVWLDDWQIHPRLARKTVVVKGRLGNATGGATNVVVGLGLLDRFDARPRFPTTNFPVACNARGGSFAVELPVPEDAATWDEFTPRLLELTAWVGADLGRAERRHLLFGLREITVQDRQFLLNGRPAFFRGTLECCIFPRTGYPPTDVESWQRILRVCKDHGLNHIRFHSWCPPEAAFVAADELGFYYQVECGAWAQPGNGKAIDQWLYDESERIVRTYGNHPSFMLLTHGNEPHGPKREEYLARWVNHWKRDGRFLVTSGSAYPQLPENQYHVYYPCRGPHGWLGKDYRKDVAPLAAPAIVHEMGQWCVYPNFDEMAKYTGPLQPKNLEIFRDSLAEHGMLGQWPDFLRASGRLQALCYKEECEAALRTPGIGGVQLLDLHDFPGQGTALVGVLDPFWDSKGYVTSAEFRRFFGATVPLARLLKRAWSADETLNCDVEVAHFGPAPLERATANWRLLDTAGKALASGEFPAKDIPLGQGTRLGRIELPLARLPAPAACKLVVGVRGGAGGVFENDWNVWVYPAQPAADPDDVPAVAALDTAALARLEAGGRVLLATSKLSPAHPKLGFEPIFWNRYMFHTQARQTLGLWCDPRHPALARFPTEAWQDWQWHDIVTQARGVLLDDWPRSLRPIAQPIDDWNTNRRLGLVFECRVGRGRLLVCAADLMKDLEQRPAARQLRASLLAYAAGPSFEPQVEIPPAELTRVLHWAARSTLVNLGARVVKADSEDRAHGNTADKAIDGDPDTLWHTAWGAADPPFPHELVIDLTQELDLRGFRLLPRQDMQNGWFTRYEFYVSPDGRDWGEPAAKGSFAAEAAEKVVEFKEARRGRLIRLVALAGFQGRPWAAVAELDVLKGGSER